MKLMDRSGCLRWEEKDQVGIIKIWRKPANTIPSPDFADPKIVEEWINRENIKGVIVTGEGKHFSAGADMEQFKTFDYSSPEFIESFKYGRAILELFENIDKPVIASIDGACIGGGLEIALACDIRYCSHRAFFGFTELNHGIIPALGGIDRLVKEVGRSKAMEVLLIGDTFNAEHAKKIGLVNKVINEKSAFSYAMEIIEGIISKGEKPVSYAIEAINNTTKMDMEKALNEESKMFTQLVISQYGGGGEK